MQQIFGFFDFCNSLALLAWALMLFTPRWKYTEVLVLRLVFPVLFAMAYVVILPFVLDLNLLDLTKLENLKMAFAREEVLLLGWIHYLAFDLLVGCWIFQKSFQYGLPAWLRIVALLATFTMGPVGFLFFVLLIRFRTKTWITL